MQHQKSLSKSVPERGIFTIACGQKKYLQMAKMLGRSLKYHNPGLACAVVTDRPHRASWSDFDSVIEMQPNFGSPFQQKLHLDWYAPFEETLFLDCDSLICDSVSHVWQRFSSVPVGVFGGKTADGRWYGANLCEVLNQVGLPWMAGFNSGLVFIRKSSMATTVFATARELATRYNDFGFDRRHGQIMDEPLIGLALGRHGIEPVLNDGRCMNHTFQLQSQLVVDILRGGARFRSYGREVNPAIVHFCCYTHSPIYYRECCKLQLLGRRRRNDVTNLRIQIVETAANAMMRTKFFKKLSTQKLARIRGATIDS